MNKETESNDLQVILTHAIEQMKQEQGDKFDTMSTCSRGQPSIKNG